TGGGTGGHLAIVKAVKEALVAVKNEDLVYVGSTKGQDKQWFEHDDDFKEKYFFETRGVVNQGKLGKIKSLFMMGSATLKAVKILRKHKAKVVFSVGGFSAAPMAFAAKLAGTPLVIHEQNAALGSLNKLLKPYANYFISSYLEESPIKAYPIKQIFFDNAHLRSKVKTIIFLGGSQGARAINNLALEIAPKLKEKGIKIIHQAGVNNIDEVQKAYEALGIEAEVFGFTTKLAEYMNEADFAIARSGASTLWELSATAVPTLYIPYPYAASDHQYYNAQFLVEQNLVWIMREKEISIDNVLKLLDEDLTSKSQGLIEIVEKEGSKKIAALLSQI
ncbi:MAG: UDP-N-acetylglucosamine--N-acetylmuramyl-(pentapeptide) pyrophosphoryl-undecaprenol N-acetylglucosamine transferase, partial [Epsilonproteobacteria bacterium]|nr:UDP-N-acetylglucosamine--N-acetylmuramyl-(pentapeptide) pyrophosphoryl-undecaprenol N-acetylglucosamine transferase [Campylobacterota bacterium]